MSPELKAKELTDKYKPLVTTWDCAWDNERDPSDILKDAKKCALISVNEIIPSTWRWEWYKKQGYIDVDERLTTDYWEQVKTHIENL